LQTLLHANGNNRASQSNPLKDKEAQMNDEAMELLMKRIKYLEDFHGTTIHRVECECELCLLRSLLAQPKAAPQPSTAMREPTSSSEGVGQGEVASAAPDSGMPEEESYAERLSYIKQFILECHEKCPELARYADVIAFVKNEINPFIVKARRDTALSLRERERWIPVSERLPQGEFLACNLLQGNVRFVAWWDSPYKVFRCTGGDIVGNREIWQSFTHWMPLPAPPAGEKKKGPSGEMA
jgi:hypothetical protein